MLRRQLVTGLLMTVVLTVLLGLVYPLVVTGISQLTMSNRANGSLVKVDGKVVGSSLIGQSFADKDGNPMPKYF
jgi:K+-transporting ATPase ATPase C chain